MRAAQHRLGFGAGIEDVALGVEAVLRQLRRITSYNVCYTKLLRARLVPLSGPRVDLSGAAGEGA